MLADVVWGRTVIVLGVIEVAVIVEMLADVVWGRTVIVLGVIEGTIEEEGKTARGENETVAVVGASMTELLFSDCSRIIMLLVAPV
jgi:hypothetical protein